MNCEQALILISAALDGEVTESERAALAEHLEECPDCRALSEDFGVYSVALSDMTAAAPDDLTARVDAALDALEAPAAPVQTKSRHHRKAWGSLAAMFAVVVCLGAVSTLLNGSRSSAPMADAGATGSAAEQSISERALEDGLAETSCDASKTECYELPNSADKDYSSVGSVTVENGSCIVADETFAPNTEATPAEPAAPAATPGDSSSSTPAMAAEQVFLLLGDRAVYPDAAWDESCAGYILEQTETEEGSFTVLLQYTGLSGNGRYHTFRLCHEQTDDLSAEFSILNNYAVALDGSAVIFEYDEAHDDAHAQNYRAQVDE